MCAQRLKELRKLNGLSQATLSSLLGVTQQAVGKWETGRSTPDPVSYTHLDVYKRQAVDRDFEIRQQQGDGQTDQPQLHAFIAEIDEAAILTRLSLIHI